MTRGRKAAVAFGAIAVVGVAIASPAAQGVGITALAKRALNADQVDGISATRSPKPNTLVALDRNARLPASVIPQGAPSGRTYTGVVGMTALAAGAPNADDTLSSWMGAVITLPALPKTGLEDGAIGILGGGIEVPDCEGSFEAPTAPKGHLCIYPGREIDEPADIFFDDAEVVNIAKNGEGALEAFARPIGDGKRGVRVEAKAAAAGASKFYATWAYTAP